MVRIDNSLIDYAADRNPEKYGARTLGTDIPIISEAESRAMHPTTTWCFLALQDEFLAREREALDRGVGMVFPCLPSRSSLGSHEPDHLGFRCEWPGRDFLVRHLLARGYRVSVRPAESPRFAHQHEPSPTDPWTYASPGRYQSCCASPQPTRLSLGCRAHQRGGGPTRRSSRTCSGSTSGRSAGARAFAAGAPAARLLYASRPKRSANRSEHRGRNHTGPDDVSVFTHQECGRISSTTTDGNTACSRRWSTSSITNRR